MMILSKTLAATVIAAVATVGSFLPLTNGHPIITAFLNHPTQQPRRQPFVSTSSHRRRSLTSSLYMSSYVSDSEGYTSSESDYDFDDETTKDGGPSIPSAIRSEKESPVVECTPPPISKNGGNRFLAFVFDKALEMDPEWKTDVLEMEERRRRLTEDHVMFCREANLYNDTFNVESMADVVFSYPILSSDLLRSIGHCMCIESTNIEHVHTLLSRDPWVQMLTKGDTSSIPLYRWRHIKDHTLRIDDGRYGFPTMMLALDHTAEEGVGNLRAETNTSHLEYLIRSERVIAAGPIHLPTEYKDDPSSIAVGDVIFFNAANRTEAIEFAENDPSSLAGLYSSVRVHRYNTLDVTGKFVATNHLNPESQITDQMKEAMGIWGYPVDDEQTPWLNK